jgi:DNA-binding NtrC family response regulator
MKQHYILVVDKNADIKKLVKDILDITECTVLEADGQEDAVEILQQNLQIDLVLIAADGGEGFEILRAAQKMGHLSQRWLMSGVMDTDMKLTALRLGAVKAVSKFDLRRELGRVGLAK